MWKYNSREILNNMQDTRNGVMHAVQSITSIVQTNHVFRINLNSPEDLTTSNDMMISELVNLKGCGWKNPRLKFRYYHIL
jgi:hypothetical protein